MSLCHECILDVLTKLISRPEMLRVPFREDPSSPKKKPCGQNSGPKGQMQG